MANFARPAFRRKHHKFHRTEVYRFVAGTFLLVYVCVCVYVHIMFPAVQITLILIL